VRARQRLFDSQPIATLSLILGLITVGTTVAAAADPVQNFGSPLSIPSPDGRFVAGSYLANPEEVETQGPEYDLFIRAQRTGKERILTRFMRSADVHWSPDSRHVAVTFWASSSDSHVVVYSPDSPEIEKSVRSSASIWLHYLKSAATTTCTLRPFLGHDTMRCGSEYGGMGTVTRRALRSASRYPYQQRAPEAFAVRSGGTGN